MGRSTTSTPRTPAGLDGRTAILAAAQLEFADVGYDRATTGSIARRAHVTQPLVHYHFGTKAELWEATLASVFEPMHTALVEVLADLRDADPLSRLKAVVRRYIRLNGQRPGGMRILHNAEGGSPVPLAEVYERHVRPIQQLLAGAVADAQRAGQLKALPVDEVLIVLAGAGAHVFGRAPVYALQSGVDVLAHDYIDAHADAVIDIVFDGLATAPPAHRG